MRGVGCSAGVREAATIQTATKNGRRHVRCAGRNFQNPIPVGISLEATEMLRAVRAVTYHSDVEEIVLMTRHAEEGRPS